MCEQRERERSCREMYRTRPSSLYRASPGAATEPPPEGPHSGYLVYQDEEYEAGATCCWGLCKDPYLISLPFPQNRLLTVEYTVYTGTAVIVYQHQVFFFPVPGYPLSCNRYYVVRAQGKHAGNVCACSREEDKRNCCFCSCVKDVKPRPFDHGDIYQQVEVVPYRGCGTGFYAKAVAPDGFPPEFLRRKGWRIFTSQSGSLKADLGTASGVDGALRALILDINFAISSPRSPAVIVGKWYCPFVFLKEDRPPKEQMKEFVFYEVTLEQFWEAVHTCENTTGKLEGTVKVSAGVRRESALLRGGEPVSEELPVADGWEWFRPARAAGVGVGLSTGVVERMRWEQGRRGWEAGEGAVERVEEYRGGGWGRFGCYVLVERYAVRSMDGSTVLAYDFRHVGKVITKWE
ncbi:hypothetical protein Taro_051462 [Colocasia esculenta]|uniref:Uncharacterized protein n=1 Tax=Colocasia esculenta TaxID=4460 RepID=A0A843XGY4_COLES|nr:hypothetical protein [Colocasia esculenta]